MSKKFVTLARALAEAGEPEKGPIGAADSDDCGPGHIETRWKTIKSFAIGRSGLAVMKLNVKFPVTPAARPAAPLAALVRELKKEENEP